MIQIVFLLEPYLNSLNHILKGEINVSSIYFCPWKDGWNNEMF